MALGKNNYFIYSNIEELYSFLINNTIYPDSDNLHALSLSKKGFIYLSKLNFSQKFIDQSCRYGVNLPLVIEVSIKNLKDKNLIKMDDGSLLTTKPISFNSVVSIYPCDDDIPVTLFNDLYLFRSLISNSKFEYGTVENYDLKQPTENHSEQENVKWDKIQGYYCCRYSDCKTVKTGKKNQISAYCNIDADLGSEILGYDLANYCYNAFGTSKYFDFKEPNCSDRLFNFIDNNFDSLIKNKKIKNPGIDLCSINALYEACLKYKKGDTFLNLIGQDLLLYDYIFRVESIIRECGNSIYEIKKALINENSFTRLIFVLDAILDKDYDNTLEYLSNFKDSMSDVEKRCILMLYGLCVGLSSLTRTIKKERPDLLLFAFNKTRKCFKEYIDNNINASKFFSLRNVTTDYVTNEGFNLLCFSKDYETDYINLWCKDLLIRQGLPKEIISKELTKFKDNKQLHNAYLLIKKGKY